jgi:hypothetical protein
MGSNPTQGMDSCVRLFCVCVVLCVGSGHATGSSPVQGVLPNVYRIKKLKSGQGPTKPCRVIEELMKRKFEENAVSLTYLFSRRILNDKTVASQNLCSAFGFVEVANEPLSYIYVYIYVYI